MIARNRMIHYKKKDTQACMNVQKGVADSVNQVTWRSTDDRKSNSTCTYSNTSVMLSHSVRNSVLHNLTLWVKVFRKQVQTQDKTFALHFYSEDCFEAV